MDTSTASSSLDLGMVIAILVGSLIIGFVAEVTRALIWCAMASAFYRRVTRKSTRRR